MRAVIIREFGTPDVFEMVDLPIPEPDPDSIRVKIHATAINPVDSKIRRFGSWANVVPPQVIGYDASGVVDAVGANVTEFKVGDAVFYTPNVYAGSGTYAEYQCVPAQIVAHKPQNLSHIEAAVIPTVGCTAWDMVVTEGGVQLGDVVLVHGVGGVGQMVVQIARAAGAHIIATSSPATMNLARELGADRVINYKDDDFVEVVSAEYGDAGVDVVIDTTGGDNIERSFKVCKWDAKVIAGATATIPVNSAYPKNPTVLLYFLNRQKYQIEACRRLCEAGQIKPVIDRVLPLEQIAEAHRLIDAGGLVGKIAIQVV